MRKDQWFFLRKSPSKNSKLLNLASLFLDRSLSVMLFENSQNAQKLGFFLKILFGFLSWKVLGIFQNRKLWQFFSKIAYFVSNTFKLIVLLKSSQNIPFVRFFEKKMSFYSRKNSWISSKPQIMAYFDKNAFQSVFCLRPLKCFSPEKQMSFFFLKKQNYFKAAKGVLFYLECVSYGLFAKVFSKHSKFGFFYAE